jgi:hypothetical protein
MTESRIGKTPLAVVGIALTVFTMVVGVVYGYGALNTRVDVVEETTQDVALKVVVLEQRSALCEQSITDMKDDVKEIKSDVKILIKQSGGENNG